MTPLLALVLAASSARAGQASVAAVARVAEGTAGLTEPERVSADGFHVAYLLYEGEHQSWYLDGRRVGTYPRGATLPDEDKVALNRDGTRLAVAMIAFDERGAAKGQAVFVNGAEGPLYTEVKGVEFSRDGRRLKYLAKRDGLWRVVVDGKEGLGFPTEPVDFQFRRDGAHFAYLARYSDGFHVMLDHAHVQPWPDSKLFLSPDFRVRGHREGDGKAIRLGDKTYGPFERAVDVFFSDDGRRFAIEDLPGGGARVWLDGTRPGPVLSGVSGGGLFAGGHLYYGESAVAGHQRLMRDVSVQADVGTFLLDGPKIACSPSGRRCVTLGQRDGADVLFVDGQPATTLPEGPLFHSRLVFDGEDEVHWIGTSHGGLAVYCASLSGGDPARSTCARAARRLHPPTTAAR